MKLQERAPEAHVPPLRHALHASEQKRAARETTSGEILCEIARRDRGVLAPIEVNREDDEQAAVKLRRALLRSELAQLYESLATQLEEERAEIKAAEAWRQIRQTGGRRAFQRLAVLVAITAVAAIGLVLSGLLEVDSNALSGLLFSAAHFIQQAVIHVAQTIMPPSGH